MQHRIKASIIGITGYTGLELLRLLSAHPHVEIVYLCARDYKDEPIGNIFPHLAHMNHKVTDTSHETLAAESDVVFVGLPHGTAQTVVAELHGKTKIIDLSADYRLDDLGTYKKYYGEHRHPDLLKGVVYGLPEIIGHDAIKKAQTLANPGCFALLGQLLLFPFKDMIEQADIFALTGSSGSGKNPSEGTHHPIRNHNIKSYNINAHRHIPEITQTAGIDGTQLNFVPTSGPFTRGIFAQAFIKLKQDIDLKALVEKTYKNAPFIRIMDEIALANIVGSNFCDLSFQAGSNNTLLAQGVLDNLVKGAAGTAVQNMNLMFGLDETEGLMNLGPVYP